MKKLITILIKQRNPDFTFDQAVTNRMLLSFCSRIVTSMMRASIFLWHGKLPKFAMVGKGLRLMNSSSLRFGKFLKLGDQVELSALGTEGIQLGNQVSIGSFSRLIVATTLNDLGKGIKIGNNVGIGEYAYLGGAGGLEIGDDCIVGQYFSCHPENHNYEDPFLPIRRQGVSRKGIKIGSNCWVGSKVSILDGVEIGSGSVIAAGAVVTRSFPANSIIGGVPAKIIKSRIEENEKNTSQHIRSKSL